MLEPPLFLAQSIAEIRSQLRWELLNIAVAVVLVSLGSVATVLFFSRRKARELTLILFGLSAFLYGVRLLASLKIIQSIFPYSAPFWDYVRWVITCTINLPFGLFLYQLVGERLKKLFRWVVTIQAVFALVGIPGAFFGVHLEKLNRANSVVVLGSFFTLALFLLAGRRPAGPRKPVTPEIRVFIAGFLVWVLFVIQENLSGLHILAGHNIEFLGFFVFVCCLGYVTARRSFAKEESLLNLNKELEIARQIQSSILPREIPHLSSLDIAARYVPMSAVAGDFYDFLAVDAQRVGILVADVTGHGVPAALIASMLKIAFAGQSENAEDPARVLAGLNRALCGKFEDHFVTAVYVFVDVGKGVLRYAGAGHPPLLLVSSSNDRVRSLEENGLMLGLFPEAAYTAAAIRFDSGDRCLLYTDGLFEAMDAAQEEFGKARLGKFLQTHRELSAPRLATELLEEISRWSGHAAGRRQDDDITLLVVDFQNSPSAGMASV